MFFDCIDDVHRLCQKERRLAPPAPASQPYACCSLHARTGWTDGPGGIGHCIGGTCPPLPPPLFWQIGQKESRNKNGHFITNCIPKKLFDLPPFLQSYHTYFHELFEKARGRRAAAVLAMLLHPLDEYVEKMPERIMICTESVLLYLLVSPHTTKAQSQWVEILSKRVSQKIFFSIFVYKFVAFILENVGWYKNEQSRSAMIISNCDIALHYEGKWRYMIDKDRTSDPDSWHWELHSEYVLFA